MSKKSGTIICIIAIIALCVSAADLFMNVQQNKQTAQIQAEQAAQDVQYVMYLGTNDKDTNKPVFNHKKAKAKAVKILVDHFGGYTIQEARGGWADDGKLYKEYTLVIYLSDTNLEDVHAAADDLIKKFHQSSVLIQSNKTGTEFYSGAE